MSINIPLAFRNRWNRFFLVDVANFLGVDTGNTPFRTAFLWFLQLAIAFGIVCVLGWAVTKIIKEIFG